MPWWINWIACIGSVILAWMGLGQFALMRRARETVRANPRLRSWWKFKRVELLGHGSFSWLAMP